MNKPTKTISVCSRKYERRLAEIQDSEKRRMGYPTVGSVVKGYFTKTGFAKDPDGKPLVDFTCLGIAQDSFAATYTNNMGSPFVLSKTMKRDTKLIEQDLLKIMARYFSIPENSVAGYVTGGGTEGNTVSLWWARNYLIAQNQARSIKLSGQIRRQKKELDLYMKAPQIPSGERYKRCFKKSQKIDLLSQKAAQLAKPILYASNHAHYSVPKAADQLNIEFRYAPTLSNGSINTAQFEKLIKKHRQKEPDRPIIVVATLGATELGAIDNLPKIKEIMAGHVPSGGYCIHADGAFLGPALPILKPFGKMKGHILTYADTFCMSGHKLFAAPQECGIVLTSKNFLMQTLYKGGHSKTYTGGIDDITLVGSRTGLTPVMLHLIAHELGFNASQEKPSKFKKLVRQNLENARYLYGELIKRLPKEQVTWRPGQFIVAFPRPKNPELLVKYGIMPIRDNRCSICVLANVDKQLIDAFLSEYFE
ncbi:MAG: pyridoxal-dependent decarboxylase [Elusimicrobia bacterium]|nr:pyridoxal-dependent decarboxylase [Elusimicrobiota bacterium]